VTRVDGDRAWDRRGEEAGRPDAAGAKGLEALGHPRVAGAGREDQPLPRVHLLAARVLVDHARVSAQGPPVLSPVAAEAGVQGLLAGQGRGNALGEPLA